MSEPGGVEEVRDLLRAHGEAGIANECENAGLKPMRRRFKCPRPPCAVKPERTRNAGWFAAEHGIFRWKCHSCDDGGTLVDLLVHTRNWTVAEAIAHLRGQGLPTRPALRVVPPVQAPDTKLQPVDVKRIWEALATSDEHGRLYLEGRGLDGGKFVRFATEQHPDAAVKAQAKRQRRVAMLLTDVVGNPRSIQFRLVREPNAKEPKQMTLKDTAAAGAFFGQPELVEASPVICVTEGMADTLAVAQWSELRACVVGAAGMGNLARLAEELKTWNIQLEGKVFALFPQNDRPTNKSRMNFVRLSRLLADAGAHPVLVGTPEEFKDVALWREKQPDMHWPPLELAKALGDDAEHESPATELMLPEGSAVPVPKLFKSEHHYAQDFSSLLSLLDDAVHREAIMGRGEFSLNEMTERPLYGGRELKDSDVSAIRYGLEQAGVQLESKPLKFSQEDVHMAMKLIASRKRVHPVREWLQSLHWDGKHLIDTELPLALGLQIDSFEAHLVRRWLISAVARAMQPGCKVDTVLVLVGPQGAGKSSFFAAIGGEWFSDERVNVEDKDGKLIMRSAWIVEWAELDAMRRARDQESIKAFLSQRIDRFRPPYGRDVVEAPRHCVIVGTTNNTEFLTDTTGSRRFWPISAEGIDVNWVRTHRAELLAEAVSAYQRKEQWWLEPEYEKLLAERNREHETRDAWEQLVTDWLRGEKLMSFVTTDMVLVNAVDKKKEHWTHYDRTRVGGILSRLGWKGVRRRVGEEVLRGFCRPGELFS